MSLCEICLLKTTDHQIIFRSRDGVKYRLHQCDACKVVRLREPKPKTAEYYRSGEYRVDVPRTPDAVASARKRDALVMRAILDLYGPRKVERALDMCVEDDSVARILDGLTCPVDPHCAVTLWGIDDGPIANVPENFFDLVTCFLSLEHIEHPVEMIRDGLQRLHPDGIFVASVPYVDLDLGIRPHHTWYYRGHSLEEAVRLAGGMVLAELRYTPYKYIAAARP